MLIIERGLTVALRANLVVFDNEAPNGKFTKRLLALMGTIAKRRGFFIERIYLPSDAFPDIVEWIPNNDFYGDLKAVKFLGVELHFLEELNEDNIYIQMLKDMGGTIQSQDSYLIIGTDGINFLLGCY